MIGLRSRYCLVKHGGFDDVLGGFEIVAIAYDYGRADQKEEAGSDQPFGAVAGASPFFQGQSPEGGEDDD